VRPRLRRLASRWRKPPEPTAAPTVTDEVAVRGDAPEEPSVGGETKRRLADAQARLKQAVPPKDE
jgi:hypothetical protein